MSFAAPPTRRSGDIEEEYLGQIVDAFGIDHDQVLAHQWVDNGPGWAVVRLATAHEVLELQPDLSRIPTAMVGAIGAHPDGSEHAFELRTFAPGVGVAEDPVCGSMNAAVAQWLLRTGAVSGSYRVSQGRRLGRAGDVTITADPDGTIWVGGNTNTLFNGAALAHPTPAGAPTEPIGNASNRAAPHPGRPPIAGLMIDRSTGHGWDRW